MTTGAIPENDVSSVALRRQSPDRIVLSRQQLDVVTMLLDAVNPVHLHRQVLEMECTEEHVFGDFQIDVHRRKVVRCGKPVHLTPREYELLLALARRDGAPASVDKLAKKYVRSRSLRAPQTLAQHV